MSGGWWCCCGCTTYEDDFERSSPPIGGSWIDCGDTASIVDGRLKIPSGGKVVLEEMAAPVNEEVGIFIVECEIWTPAGIHTGTVYKLNAFEGNIGSPCSGKTGDYYTVTATIGPTQLGITTVELRLYHNGVQIGNLPKQFGTTESTFNLMICVSKDMIVAGKDTWMILWTCPDEEYGTDGHYFSIETSGGDGYIESAFYTDHYDHDKLCPNCDVNCCCPCLEDMEDRSERRLVATLTTNSDNPIYNCEDMNMQSLLLYCYSVEFECCDWIPVDSNQKFFFDCKNQDGYLEGYTYALEFTMTCESLYQECTEYVGRLSWAPGYANYMGCYPIDWSLDNGVYYLDYHPIAAECKCRVDPDAGDDDDITLTFGPYSLVNNPANLYGHCFCCDEFYVVVTVQ
jgi:hypothetical protein